MTLEEKIMADIKSAMREKDREKLTALRAVKSAILLAKTEKGKSGNLKKPDEMRLLQKLVKQREESAAIYKQQNRMDLYEKEMEEARVIGMYLPEPLDGPALRKELEQIIQNLGASSMKDMGRVMKDAGEKLAGRASGSEISKIVRELLAG